MGSCGTHEVGYLGLRNSCLSRYSCLLSVSGQTFLVYVTRGASDGCELAGKEFALELTFGAYGIW